jgi:hypothetical protein
MPALTRFSLTDYTEKGSGRVRIRLKKAGGLPSEVKEALPVGGSMPPRYEWLGGAGVNAVIGIDYVLQWDHPLYHTRYHWESMSSPHNRHMAQATVEVNVYCDATNAPPTDDCFLGTHWSDIYTPSGGLAQGPWEDATLVYAKDDPCPFAAPPPPPPRMQRRRRR